MRKFLFAFVGAASLIAAGGALAQVQRPPGAPPIEPAPTVPLGTPMLTCNVDLDVTSVTLTKTSTPGAVRVTYEIHNVGRSAFASSAGQQQATLAVRNNNTGNVVTRTRALGTRAAAGARLARVSTSTIANAFDTHEFAGTVDVSIAFDPDIAIDGNACNDDANAANNRLTITTEQVWAFISGSASSQVFR